MHTKVKMAFFAAAVACAGIIPLCPNDATAQPYVGQWFLLHTNPHNGCQGLDWHLLVDADHEMYGFVAWDRMKHSAKLTGKSNGDGTFTLVGEEVGGTRKANISGKVTSTAVQFTITGTGTPCDNQTFSAPRQYWGGGGD